MRCVGWSGLFFLAGGADPIYPRSRFRSIQILLDHDIPLTLFGIIPLLQVVTEDGLMRPVLAARKGGLFAGGSARMVEKALGVEGDSIL